MAKHHKRAHNGKDRKTGRKIKKRPKKEVKRPTGRRVGNPKPVMPVLPRPRPQCCETAEMKDLVNKRLIAELSTLRWDKDWNEVTGTWVRVMPRHFVAKYRKHMAHFRAVAREHFGL